MRLTSIFENSVAMGAAFYILFLLVASPVKREDACRTTNKPGKTLGVSPTVVLDPDTLTEYKYSATITLKWFIQPPNQFQVTNFYIKVSKGLFEHSGDGQCYDDSTDDCLSYPIPIKLHPGVYKVELTVSVSANSGTQNVKAEGSFTVKHPLNLMRPVDDHVYEEGERVVAEWSVTDTNVRVKHFQISIWLADEYEGEAAYKDDKGSSETKSDFGALTPGSYVLEIYMFFTDGTTLPSPPPRHFKVFKIPLPVVNPSARKTYKPTEKIIIQWTIDEPTDRIESYEILVWELNYYGEEQGEANSYSADCPDVKTCRESSDLRGKLQGPATYRCYVRVTTRNGQKKRSGNYRDVVLESAPLEEE